MDIDFSGFGDFEIKNENIEIKQAKDFDRHKKIGIGGSIAYHILYDGIIYFGALDSKFYAVDAKTGEILWIFATDDRIIGKASISENMIFFGSFDGYMYCLDRFTGKEYWRTNTGGGDLCKLYHLRK